MGSHLTNLILCLTQSHPRVRISGQLVGRETDQRTQCFCHPSISRVSFHDQEFSAINSLLLQARPHARVVKRSDNQTVGGERLHIARKSDDEKTTTTKKKKQQQPTECNVFHATSWRPSIYQIYYSVKKWAGGHVNLI